MSKINNLALTLYNKDRHQLMKLYNNNRTSQLRKDIIREIFNQEGGEPFIFFDEEKNKYIKDINKIQENEIIYVTYAIKLKYEYFMPFTNWASKFLGELYNYNYNDETKLQLEEYYINICKEHLEEIKDRVYNNSREIICTFGIYKKENIVIGFNFFTIKSNVHVDDQRDLIYLYTQIFPQHEYPRQKFPCEKMLDLGSYIYIYEDFQGLSICKPLFYENVKLSTLIFKDINTVENYVRARNRNMAYLCYDNAYFKCNYKYRISFLHHNDNIKELNLLNNIKDECKKSADENRSIKEIHEKMIYFKDFNDLYLNTFILVTCKLTIDLYEKYDINPKDNINSWCLLLYKYIFGADDWYNQDIFNVVYYDYKEQKYLEFNIKEISKIQSIRSLIIPTNIYENQIDNNIYVLIDSNLSILEKLKMIKKGSGYNESELKMLTYPEPLVNRNRIFDVYDYLKIPNINTYEGFNEDTESESDSEYSDY